MIHVSKPYLGDEEKKAVMAVLESGMLAQGKQTAALEEKFTDICKTRYAIATSSGTTALQVALMAHEIGPGAEVITTPFTFIATINAILSTGATPIFVDINEHTFNIDTDLIEAKITSRTKAILPVHLYGHMCEMDKISELAMEHKLAIIEDAAQAVGSEYHSKRAGSFGTGCFSLYATKNIMSGEGGMITTDDEDIATRCRMIRSHGSRQRYMHEILGYNYRISDLHAAIGVVQCDRLEGFTLKRIRNAAFLSENLKSVLVPTVEENYRHVWHQYTVRVREGMDRDEVVQRLYSAGIGTGIFYPIPAHQQEYLRNRSYAEVTLPTVEKITKEVFSLPVHPQLTETDLEKIVDEVNKL